MTLQRKLKIVSDGGGADDATPAVRIAFASADRRHVDQHFGAAEGFVIYNLEPERCELLEVAQFRRLDMDGNEDKLAANKIENAIEIERAIELANDYEDIVVAINVGNEALVDWNDHMVPLEQVIAYVRTVKAAVSQPVTVADNYEWWIRDGAPLAAEVDFLGVHTYPAWENKTIDEGLSYTIQNIEDVHAALPDKPIAILEAGWATTAVEPALG